MSGPVNVPPGFRVWNRYWFACPHCGFRAYSAVGRLEVPKDRSGMAWRFWCPQCQRRSLMKRPQRVGALMLVATVGIFVALYFAMSALVRSGTPLFAAVVIGIGAALFATYRVIPLVSKAVNEYEPEENRGQSPGKGSGPLKT